MLDRGHPFFRHAWRRWAAWMLPAGWAVFEAMSGAWGWALVFAGLAGWALWELILRR